MPFPWIFKFGIRPPPPHRKFLNSPLDYEVGIFLRDGKLKELTVHKLEEMDAKMAENDR